MKNYFSHSFKEVLSLSREEAVRLHSDVIGTEHLLLALKRRGEVSQDMEAGMAAGGGARGDAAVDAGPGKGMVIQKTGLFGFFRRKPVGMRLSREAERAIRGAVEQAKQRQSLTVEPAHLVLSIIRLGGDPGITSQQKS